MHAVANAAGAVQALLTASGTASDTARIDSAALCNSLTLLRALLEPDSGKQAFAAASGAQQLHAILKDASGATQPYI